MLTASQAETHLSAAIAALDASSDWKSVLDQLPVPIYTVDAGGAVTYWNQACADFAGRRPKLGKDRWCVTWKIYTTTGERLPHDQCPMAEAVRASHPIRGAVAIALRPDGRRVAFTPYPTPLFGKDGALTGAINMLIDVSEEQSTALAEQARRCRRLAGASYDREICEVLGTMADEYERTVADLRSARRGPLD
jgi:PAS domain S-box-containing protein